MEAYFQKLVILLNGQKEIYEEILKIGQKKQEELIKGSMMALDEINKQEELLILQCGRLEEERYHCVQKLVKEYNLKEGILSEILSVAPKPQEDELRKIVQEITAIIEALAKINQENMSLIQQSLHFINYSIEAISQPQESKTYNLEREVKLESTARILDKKV